MTLTIGSRLGANEILSLIGSGGEHGESAIRLVLRSVVTER
jgi:hypothetical protein